MTNTNLHGLLLEIYGVLYHGTINLVHITRKHYICADFIVRKGVHSAHSSHWDRPRDSLESLFLRDKLTMYCLDFFYFLLLCSFVIQPKKIVFQISLFLCPIEG